ncbi:MAG TPA: SDR family oxidoreductase [Blastocatellia bacterium]|nr:SDR family oxidoreductase [Blastocatellia bacterium]
MNTVGPGVVETPMHAGDPKESSNTRSPMGEISTVKDIADAIVYLAEARHVIGEILYVDGGAHAGKW